MQKADSREKWPAVRYAIAMNTVFTALKQAVAEGGVARLEAEYLLAYVLNKSRTDLWACPEYVVGNAQCDAFGALVQRRQQGEPIAYIIGTRGFWSFDVQVNPSTLIPRPETELLVELALPLIPEEKTCEILDLGTGSGVIALALAVERPSAQILAVDYSEQALACAIANARDLRVAQIRFLRSDWYSALAGQRFNVIVSNPPYIEAGDAHLRQGDLRFEPVTALASGADGLNAIRIIIAGAAQHLHAGGVVLIEHGWNQGAAVRALYAEAGLTAIHTERDLEQRERVSCARFSG